MGRTRPVAPTASEQGDSGPRVCFIVTTDLTTIFLRGYLSFLRERGWKIVVVANDEGRLRQLGASEGVRTISIRMRRNPAPVHDLVSLFRLTLLLKRLRPDAVVYATPKASLLASTAARLSGVRARIYELWGLRYLTPGRGKFALRLLETIGMRNSTEIFSTSPSLAAKAIEDGLAANIAVLGGGGALGVNVDHFSKEAADIPRLDDETARFLTVHRGLPVVTFVGRLNRDKGVDVLVRAAEILALRGQPVAIILVGPTENEALVESIAELERSLPIHRTGWRSDPRPYILAARTLCLPTLREGFGQVIMEAGALGVPAVTTNAIGARDSVIDGVTGLLVPVSDPEALADALHRIVTEIGLSERLGTAARERSRKVYANAVVWPLHATAVESSIRNHSNTGSSPRLVDVTANSERATPARDSRTS